MPPPDSFATMKILDKNEGERSLGLVKEKKLKGSGTEFEIDPMKSRKFHEEDQ